MTGEPHYTRSEEEKKMAKNKENIEVSTRIIEHKINCQDSLWAHL